MDCSGDEANLNRNGGFGNYHIAFDKAIAGVGSHFGFPYTAYLQKGSTSIRGVFPSEWLSRYLAKSYIQVDPLFRAAFRIYEPVHWDNIQFRKSAPVVKKFFSEADDFNISSGIIVPVVHPFGGAATISFVRPNDKTHNSYTQDSLKTICSLCAAFDATFRAKIAGLQQPNASSPLSGRETQVLSWIARGKSSVEIAEILGLHLRTVALHAGNAKTKLGATTLPHAVMLAIKAGAISAG